MVNFFKNLFGMSLKSKVMKVISERIDEVQKLHDSELNDLCISKNVTVRNIVEKYKADKEAVTEKHINSILSKVL